jgi:folate-binding protein YgfZ
MANYYYQHPQAQVLEITGPDASDFLHRLSTVSFKNFQETEVKYGAFLTGKGTVLSLFTVWKKPQGYTLFFEAAGEEAYQYLNTMHFSEDLKIQKSNLKIGEYRGNQKVVGQAAYNWGIPGAYLEESAIPVDTKRLSLVEWRSLKARYGVPEFGIDFTTDHILIEGPYEAWVDRNKGCYPGQEVIEKIYTYGRLPKKIFKVKTDQNAYTQTPTLISFEDQNIGTLTSLHLDETGCFGLATLKKHYTDKYDKFVIDGHTWTVEKL